MPRGGADRRGAGHRPSVTSGGPASARAAAPTARPVPLPVSDEVALQALQDAARALDVALDERAGQRLLAYWHLLQRWNQVYNLTALRDPGEMISHHLVDCLAVLPALRRGLIEARLLAADGGAAAARPLSVLDVGSGGGLPGVVLAILQPEWRVHCVDTVAKKASFVSQVAAELGLPHLRGVHARVEALDPAQHAADLITSRAFASLRLFTDLTAGLLRPTGVWAAMKGKSTAQEEAELDAQVSVFHVEQLTVPGLDAERCLVWMRAASGSDATPR
ncbi:MAG: hypothetical protein RIQ53_3846 [Pseudomonadota bacterium]